jgi:hypothetical protein
VHILEQDISKIIKGVPENDLFTWVFSYLAVSTVKLAKEYLLQTPQ